MKKLKRLSIVFTALTFILTCVPAMALNGVTQDYVEKWSENFESSIEFADAATPGKWWNERASMSQTVYDSRGVLSLPVAADENTYGHYNFADTYGDGTYRLTYKINMDNVDVGKSVVCVNKGSNSNILTYIAGHTLLVKDTSGSNYVSNAVSSNTWYTVVCDMTVSAESGLNYTVSLYNESGTEIGTPKSSAHSNIKNITSIQLLGWKSGAAYNIYFDYVKLEQLQTVTASNTILSEDFSKKPEVSASEVSKGWYKTGSGSVDIVNGEVVVNSPAVNESLYYMIGDTYDTGKIRIKYNLKVSSLCAKVPVYAVTQSGTGEISYLGDNTADGAQTGPIYMTTSGTPVNEYAAGSWYTFVNEIDLDAEPDNHTLSVYDSNGVLLGSKTNTIAVSDLTGVCFTVWKASDEATEYNTYIDNVEIKRMVDCVNFGTESVKVYDYSGSEFADNMNVTPDISKITLDFGEEMDTSTVDVTLSDTALVKEKAFTGTWDSANQVYTLTPETFFSPDSEYTLAVAKAAASASNPSKTLENNFEMTFNTGHGFVKAIPSMDDKAVNVKSYNCTGEDKTVCILFAFYNADSTLNSVQIKTYTVTQSVSGKTFLEAYTKPDGAANAKVFVWRSMDNIAPCGTPASYTYSVE